MAAFATKEQMIAAFAKANQNLHASFHSAAAKYVPHMYRGGFVIPGFGFSVERIGRFVGKEDCGNAMLVK